ncbi:MAG: GreA/GreB family elongation factor, partial [Verrucomicrobiales bacterium]
RLKSTPALADLNKNSLLARVIKAHPETQQMVSGEAEDEPEDEGLVVSWESLEKRKEQLEDILKNKIPENTKEISVAASYGDLRENFEFKAAKDMQSVLMRQKDDLEMEITLARGTDFSGVDATKVNVGTIVTLRDDAGEKETYSILGAWDTDLDKGIISYLSNTSKALIGKKVGDEVQVASEDSDATRTVIIESIEAFKK